MKSPAQWRYIFKTVRINVIYLTFILFFPCQAFANEAYRNYLITKSQELKLSQNPKWLNMVYYEKSRFLPKYESVFDSKDFFLAKNGKTDPQAELEATIRSFFDSDLKFKSPYQNNQNAVCTFKGRYEWLKKQLNFDSKKLIEPKCADFQRWKNALNPKSATLIFASSYLNNPSSMFGHTFLLINSDDRKETQNILSNDVNYSANTNETNGIAFAYKGLFGFYNGQFSTLKYHKMLKKYTNLENRDLWEYDLNLTYEELDEILNNLWEIGNNEANYYFFSENCSYILLKLLKITNNDIKINKKLLNFVIPSDTIIGINQAKGLIKNSKYRPSRASNIGNLMKNSDKNMMKLAKIISIRELNESEQQNFDNLRQNQQKITYDLAYEYSQYFYQKNKKIKRDEMAKLSFKILNKRSKISGKTEISAIKIPKTSPILCQKTQENCFGVAHKPSRIGVKYGYNNIRKDFIRFSARQAYHDLTDSDNGFLKGAQINILDFDFDYYAKNDRLKLDQFNLFSIKSFSARNNFFKPTSWQLEIGAKNLYFGNQDLKLAALIKFGAGATFEFEKIKSNVTILLNGANYYGKNIENRNLTALIPEINFTSQITNNLKLNFNLQQNFYKQETKFNSRVYRIEQSYSLQKDLALDGYFEKKHYQHFQDENEFGIGLKYYY